MNLPDVEGLKPLKRADAEPVFDELWQAQVLAMADNLVRQGKFSAQTGAQTGQTLSAQN